MQPIILVPKVVALDRFHCTVNQEIFVVEIFSYSILFNVNVHGKGLFVRNQVIQHENVLCKIFLTQKSGNLRLEWNE